MKTAFICLLAILGLIPGISAATTFTIDPTSSYVSVPVPIWERGPAWGFIGPDGEITAEGYQWTPAIRNELFNISGKLELSQSLSTIPGWFSSLNIDSHSMHTNVPDQLGFHIPPRLSLDPSSGLLDNSCHGFSTGGFFNCHEQYPRLAVSGMLTGSNLILDGVFDSLSALWPSIFGGLEPPSLLEFDYANASYTFHIVASVPEPGSVLLLLAGFSALLLTSLGRNKAKNTLT